MVKATAAVVWEKEQAFSVEEVEVEEPRAGEVLVRIVGAGVCHTDVGLFDHDAIIYQLLSSRGSWSCGHEGAGK